LVADLDYTLSDGIYVSAITGEGLDVLVNEIVREVGLHSCSV